eukprot:54423-Amphidinium_carterae.1
MGGIRHHERVEQDDELVASPALLDYTRAGLERWANVAKTTTIASSSRDFDAAETPMALRMSSVYFRDGEDDLGTLGTYDPESLSWAKVGAHPACQLGPTGTEWQISGG